MKTVSIRGGIDDTGGLGDLGDLGGLDIDSGTSSFGAPSNTNAPPPLERASAIEEAMPIFIWVGLLAAAYAQYYFVMGAFDGEAYVESINASIKDETIEFSDVFKPIMPLYASNFLSSFFVGVFTTYLSLKTFSALLNDDFADDMKDAALYSFYCFLLMFVPIIGWIAIPIIIKKHYELSFLQLIGVIFLWCVYGGGANFIFELPIDTPAYWMGQIDYSLAPG